ncbi:hypothetical protein GpartN1_g3516.t1 [Galdieria partita]|uniref:Uncharacterized protein n=1 Tax=Galdieria partita TaxID=83374 RepID=A0A9C7UQM0_9RHOD|nr:hypothetical protein GpartN1_g3516.t1 [Galdieria partita]
MNALSACFGSTVQLCNSSLFDKRTTIMWKNSICKARDYPVYTKQKSYHTLYYYWLFPVYREEDLRTSNVHLEFALSIKMSGTKKRKKNAKNNNSKSQYSKSSDKKKDSTEVEFREPLSEANYDLNRVDNALGDSEMVNTDRKKRNNSRDENSSSKQGSEASGAALRSNKAKLLSNEDGANQHEASTTSSSDVPVAEDSIKTLTDNFKRRRDQFVQNLEKDPNYGLKRLDEDNSYDWAAALIGRGHANKKGFFLLPYLQSGHIVCLAVVLLCTFVYYPGFYLTELPESTREILRKSLVVVFLVNAILAAYAGWEAMRRNQPVVLWVIKCMFLGGLALNELQQNVPLIVKSPRQDSLLPTSTNRK